MNFALHEKAKQNHKSREQSFSSTFMQSLRSTTHAATQGEDD